MSLSAQASQLACVTLTIILPAVIVGGGAFGTAAMATQLLGYLTESRLLVDWVFSPELPAYCRRVTLIPIPSVQCVALPFTTMSPHMGDACSLIRLALPGQDTHAHLRIEDLKQLFQYHVPPGITTIGSH